MDHATYILGLAKHVYAGLSEEEIAEIEQIIRRRPLFPRDENVEKAEQVQSHGQQLSSYKTSWKN